MIAKAYYTDNDKQVLPIGWCFDAGRGTKGCPVDGLIH
jgi:hypothetical protein